MVLIRGVWVWPGGVIMVLSGLDTRCMGLSKILAGADDYCLSE